MEIKMKELVYILVFLMILFLFLFPFRYSRPKKLCELKKKKTCVILGATNSQGKNLALELSKEYQVIIASRRESKFLDLYSDLKGQDISWLYVDTRISRTIEDLFQLLSTKVGKIQLVIDLAIIKDIKSFYPISSERKHDDIYLKLQGAYTADYPGNYYRRGAPGSEYWFFTNIIGSINVYAYCKMFEVEKLVLLKTDSKLILELYQEFILEKAIPIEILKIENILPNQTPKSATVL